MDREEILRRFEVWLDEALAGEGPPQGIPAEILGTAATEDHADANSKGDLYSVWAAVTALTQEVKLQGRSFKQVSETLSPVSALAPHLPQMQREAQEHARREVLDGLLDVRDRLGRGLDSAKESGARVRESQRPGWKLWLLSGRAAIRQAAEGMTALEEGYRMSLARLNDMLADLEVREITCERQLFDPASMDAVEVQETDQEDDGRVVEVYRVGYEWKGEVYRPAQVKVARRPMNAPSGGEDDE